MNKQFVLKILGLIWVPMLCSSPSQAQYKIGIEMGTSISSLVPSNQNIPTYAQRISSKIGLSTEVESSPLWAFRTGLYYSLRGFHFGSNKNSFNQSDYWDLHCISIPILVVFKASEQVQCAVGLEISNAVGTNIPLIEPRSFLFGISGECGFHITPSFRVSAHYTHVLSRLLEATIPYPQRGAFYNNILAGISMTYILSTFSPIETHPPCPSYL